MDFPSWVGPRVRRGSEKAKLTVQVLDCEDVVPAQDKVLAEFFIVGRHQGTLDGRVLQSQGVPNLVCCHDEQVATLAAVQGPSLITVKMGLPTAGEECMGQGPPW